MKRRRERGAATVEAAISLPTLLVLLFGVRFATERQALGLEALGTARACAFRVALRGCGQVPEECAPYASRRDGRSGDAATPMRDVTLGIAEAEGAVPGLSGVRGLADAVPGLFPPRSSSSVERTLEVPGFIGDGSVRVTAAARATCNEQPSAGNVALDVFRAVAKPLLGGR